MKLWPWIAGLTAGSAAWLAYGALVESKKIVVERHTLALPGWPERLRGYRIALLADFHLRDQYSVEQGKRAVALALDESPDMVALVGDFVGYWRLSSPWLLGEVLEPLMLMDGAAVAVPGNHDYWCGDASLLAPIFDELNVKLLRNDAWSRDGITWVGVDSLNEGKAEPFAPLTDAMRGDGPIVVLWHEPDAVDLLPPGGQLMLSGHSHGGQWRFPWGWAPMGTENGNKYVEGFFPNAPTPLYVTRGVGTTGPPARLGALADVSILTLVPA